jgi:hypothetical protein
MIIIEFTKRDIVETGSKEDEWVAPGSLVNLIIGWLGARQTVN